MRKTMDIIHQKVEQTGTSDDTNEAHEAINRADLIAKIHKSLSDHRNNNSKEVTGKFTDLHNTLNDLEDQTSEQSVDQKVVKAMHKTMDIIHQKVTQKQTGTSDDTKEAHEAIKRANQIAKIHKFLNDNSSGCVCDQRNGPNDSQEVIGAFTEFHNILNSLDVPNSEQTVRGNDLKTMHGCLDNICEKIEQNSSINDVHEQIKCACCDGNSGLGVN